MSFINYIKHTIFENTRCDFIIHDDILKACDVNFGKFKKEWNKVRTDILEADSINEITAHMKLMGEIHKEHIWSKIKDNPPIKQHVQQQLAIIYYRDNFDRTEDYIENLSEKYRANTKESLFFDKNIDNLLKENFLNGSPKDTLLEDVAQKICKKFAFSHISLISEKNHYISREFLLDIESCAEKVCQDMGTSYEMLGLNKNIGFGETEQNVHGIYHPGYQTLKINGDISKGSIKTTLLHEYVHAIDNVVFNRLAIYTEQYDKKHGHSTEYKGMMEKDIDKQDSVNTEIKATLKAHHLIRKIIDGIYNADIEKVEEWVKEKESLATTKFWSILLGEQYYGISEQTKEKLCSKPLKDAIINYCTHPDNNKDYLSLQIKNVLTMPIKEVEKLIEKHQESILEQVGSYVKDSQNSPVFSKSFVLRSCEYSTSVINKNEALNNKETSNKETSNKENSNSAASFEENYYSRRTEIFARYFEANVYPIKAMISNIIKLCAIYPFKDKEFTNKKNELIENVSVSIGLGKIGVLENINKMRKLDTKNNHLSNKLV